MSEHPMVKVLQNDARYKLEAYQFVREALTYAQEVMNLGEPNADVASAGSERHLTGQQLCEASRRFAVQEYGLMAKTVLNSWGIRKTGDLGDVVYNLIEADLMRKSEGDRREDFDDVFDFRTGFDQAFSFSAPGELEL